MEEITQKSYASSTKASFNTINALSVTDAINNATSFASMGVNRVLPRQVSTGTYRGQQAIGGQNVVLDSEGSRIFIQDDANIRIILGLAKKT